MTDLRDQYAMAALPVVIERLQTVPGATKLEISVVAYEWADAMIEARDVRERQL
jgi:hypothetical protein